MPTLLHSKLNSLETSYQTNFEYLVDELRRLDVLIQIQLLKQKMQRLTNPLDQFRGLVLSEAEITELLNDDSISGSEDTKSQVLQNKLVHLETQIENRRCKSIEEGIELFLPHLATIFNLTPFEEQSLIVCLAPELDRKYEKLYAYLQDDVTRKKPSVDLILSLLLNTMEDKVAARAAFKPQAPLLKFLARFTDNDLEESTPLITRFLKLDERVVDFLLGFNVTDQRIEGAVRVYSPLDEPDHQFFMTEDLSWIRQVAQSVCKQIRDTENKVIFNFYGPDGAGKKSMAELICRELGLPLVMADLQKILIGQNSNQESWPLLGREAIFQQAALGIENFQLLLDLQDKYQADLNLLMDVIRTFSPLTFLISERPWQPLMRDKEWVFISQEFAVPSESLRKDFWSSFSGKHQLESEIDLEILASKFRFTPGQIKNSLINAEHLVFQHSPGERKIQMNDLYKACHMQSNHRLGSLARKINPKYQWNDIVLPVTQMKQLREICNQVKYRRLVYDEWGFNSKLSIGKGLNILFSGAPGTGKTMAAEVIANELSLELYKIDLSQVVSKYIGETEKNLSQIFEGAQTSNAILFFDEADALFGKRSEVKDAHDRYANIEIGYLLQKMEEYDGIVILATNLINNVDNAFLRRIHFTMEFPFPEKEERGRIWKVVFAPNAPLAADIDFEFLADRLKIVGANIKNIVLTAAFLAAADGTEIDMRNMMRATKREYQKIAKNFIKADFEPYFKLAED